MSPERKKGPAIMIAIGHAKKPPQGPPPEPGGEPKAAAAAAPAPKTKAAPAPAPDTDLDEEAGGTSQAIRPEDVDYREGELCGSCLHMGGDGSCTRYGFQVAETGHCLDGWTAKSGEEEGSEETSVPEEEAMT